MSDGGTAGELPAAGRPFGQISAGVGLNLPALTGAAEQINSVKGALAGLKDALRELGSNSYMLAQGVNNLFTGIAKSAKEASSAISGVSSSMGGLGGGGGGGAARPTAASAGGGGGGYGWATAATASASQAQAAAGGGGTGAIYGGTPPGYGGGGGGGGSIPPVGQDLTSAMIGVNTGDFTKDLLMFPLRFMRSQIETNRQTVLTSSAAMSRAAFGSNVGIGPTYGANGAVTNPGVMSMLARRPGDVQGTISDLLSLYSNATGYGAGLDWSGQGRNAPRASGFFKGVQEAQMITPGTPVAQIAGTIGGFAGNTGAQQQAQMMTGGAYGMIKPGGGQKSLSEWARSIMKWLEGLRPGNKRGKPFNYGELMAQYFPGSNIDAWFEANAVPQEMREYWWAYALNKSQTQPMGAEAGGQGTFVTSITPDFSSPLWQRMQATTEMSVGQFGLGQQMVGAYGNKEQSNRWFNRIFSDFLQKVVPGATGGGKLQFAQYMPDTMEQLLMQALERSGKFGSLVGGYLGYGFNTGSDSGAELPEWLPGDWGQDPEDQSGGTPLDDIFGDIGDIGDYTSTGGTSTAGLHPDMRRKVNRMMRANPRIKVTSGLRDHRMQQTLARRGVGKVSGRPSAHTRGMAADLGPRSEYGWIKNNASKFGLSSGADLGEPWHVGMGDIGDSPWDILGGFKDLVSGSDPVGGVVNIIQPLFNLMRGLFTGSEASQADITAGLKYNTDLFDLFIEKSKGLTVGGIAAPATDINGLLNLDENGNPIGGSMGGSNPWDNTSGAAVPVPGFGSPRSTQSGIAAATALFNAGFRKRSDLETITAISWRESGWNPSSRNPNTSDRGLMQINMSAHKSTMQSMGYDEADLMDPQKNANIAHRLWSSGGGDYDSFQQLWGFSTHSPYVPGGVGWDRNGDPLGRTQGSNASSIVSQANLPVGDIDYSNYPTVSPQLSDRGALVTFNNTFNIQGGGGGVGGGIDLRRTVTMIADHLEDEMKTRTLRAS